MSWLGIDSGAKRSGLAISWSGQMAEPLGLATGDLASQIQQIEKVIAEHAVDVVVIGKPTGVTGDHPATQMFEQLMALSGSRASRMTVITIDETLSTKEAERLLRERKGDPQQSDALAACLILEQYFEESRNQDEK